MNQHDQHAVAATVEISVLTGFLGSGKTTLLNYLLQHPEIDETAVLINEFGEVGLDHLLVSEINDDVLLLSSGCICCTVQGELVDSLKSLYLRRLAGQIPEFKRVVVETTGLADPIPIITCLMKEPLFKHTYRLETLVTTVDALYGEQQLDDHPEAVRQAAVADRIIITKTDLADQDSIDSLRSRLKILNPGAEVISAVMGRVSPNQLFNTALFDPKIKSLDVQGWLNETAYVPRMDQAHGENDEAHHGHAHSGHDHDHSDHPVDVNRHDDHISSYCIYLERPVVRQRFLEWFEDLANEKGDHLLRVKGLINLAGEEAPYAIHCVQATRGSPVRLSAWPDDDRRSRIVFITHDLPRSVIEESIESAGILLGADEVVEGTQTAPASTQKKAPSTRWLNEGEVSRIFGALLEYNDHPAAHAIRFMLLTGVRYDEVLDAQWDQFDLEKGIWMKPSPHTFHKKPRLVRLSEPALLVLRDRWARCQASGNVFFDNHTPGSVDAIKETWKLALGAAEVEDAALEALRPSLASTMFNNLDRPVLEGLLGVASNKVHDAL
ncbi:MAG: GTP-binding protein [Pseudomonadota bacterium]